MMKNFRRLVASFVAVLVLSMSYQNAVAAIPGFLKTMLDAAHVANSLIPSGDMVNNTEGLLKSCFGVFGGPEDLGKCVESLAKAAGANASQVKDLNSIKDGCADVASPECIEAVAFSDAGTDILGEILPGADILINIIKMVDAGDVWGLISKVGVDVACIAAEVMTGGVDVCGAIRFVGQAVAAVVGAVGDALAWVGDWLFGSDKDPMAALRAKMAQALDTITQHGEAGLRARIGYGNKPMQDAPAYVESLRSQVIPKEDAPFYYAGPVWEEVKAPMIAFINNRWVLEVTGTKEATMRVGLKDREAFKQQYYVWWESDAKSGNANRFKEASLDCPALFQKFVHIDAYLAKPVGPPVQAQTTEQFCSEVKAKYAEWRKQALATDLKNDTESKEKKLLGMKCTKSGNDYACVTWPAVAVCKKMDPKGACTVDAAKADEELAGRGVAEGNSGLYAGLGAGLCRRDGVSAMCYRDVATARCKKLLAAEERAGSSKAVCLNSYDTAYAKLVMQTHEIVAALNSGKNVISKSGGGSAESNYLAQVCGGAKCVKVWDKDPLVVEYVGGKVNSLPAGVVIFYDANKRMGNGCEMVSGTNNEVPQLCFGKLVSSDKPTVGQRYGDLKVPGGGIVGGGNPTKDIRDSLGRDLGTGAKVGGKVGDVTTGGANIDLGKKLVDPGKSPSGGGNVRDYAGGSPGKLGGPAGGSIDLKAQGQLDARKLEQQMATQKNLQQQLNIQAQQQQQQQQTMGGKAPAGTGFGGGTASGTATTFNKAPTTGSLPKGGSIGAMAGGSAAGGSAASGGGIAAITAGMSSAEKQAFAISCTAVPMGSKSYACSSDRALAACQSAARNAALGLTCSKK